MDNIIEIKDLYKFYGGINAVDFLNLNIKRGHILGLLGPNGSGKTTVMKIIADIIKPISGEVLIDGMKPNVETRKIVSYLPDDDFLLDWMSMKDGIKFFENFFEDFNKVKFDELLKSMNIDINLDSKVNSLSKGTREKFNLSLILARDAEIYILDEPIGGVDIITRDSILESIITTFSYNKTMIISTHLVSELENIMDDVAFIEDGKIILEGNCDDLRGKYGKNIEGIYREIYENTKVNIIS